jgi:ribosomal protein S18 acetylase RimI-like enzyme
MNTSAPGNTDRQSAPVALRPEQPGDEPFLFEVYASTREEELALTNWDAPARRAFLDMQFMAMRRGYGSMYSAGEFLIILLGARAIGRLVLNRTAAELRVVDLALLPADRNAGIGTLLMRRLCAEAAQAGKPVRLSVLKNSRAIAWYQRLGFVKNDEAAFYNQMEWRAPAAGDAAIPGSPPPGD